MQVSHRGSYSGQYPGVQVLRMVPFTFTLLLFGFVAQLIAERQGRAT